MMKKITKSTQPSIPQALTTDESPRFANTD